MTADSHVVFGTGPAGEAVTSALVDQVAVVRMVNRSGMAVVAGVETDGGDATDGEFARAVTYQIAEPFIVDDSAFRVAFGAYTTSWDEIVSSTTDWCRAQTTMPHSQDRLAEAPTLTVTS